MDAQGLIKRANNIAAFFNAEPDRAKAARAVAEHIRNFWEPRMRRAIFTHLDERSGSGLNDLVLAALREHRTELGG